MASTDRILLVEDDPSDEKLARRAFSRCTVPHELVVARDGVEALELLLRAGTSDGAPPAPLPRLVLLDLKLPRLDGLGVLAELRANERTRTLPVVVLSASREDEDLARSWDLGVSAYLRKPLDFAEFVAAAQVIAAFWLELNQPPPRRRELQP